MRLSFVNRLRWILVATMVATGVADDPPIPEIWNAVADSFDSDVLVSMPDLDPGVAFLVDERYDILEEKGSMSIVDHGTWFKYNYYSKTDQSFYIQPGNKCTVGTLMDHPGYSLFGWYYTSGNGKADPPPLDNFVFGPSALLKMTEEYRNVITYNGTTVIRNISAEFWELKLEDGHAIGYYFADESWTMPYGKRLAGINLRAPVQVTVTGLEGNPWNSKQKKFQQTVYYDYLDFKPYIAPEDWKRFLTETGLDCPKRKTLDPKETTPPEPVEDIKVYIEAITNRTEESDGIVFKAWLYYESLRKLLRLDLDTSSSSKETAPFETVQDLYTGVEYNINQWTGDCSMKTWTQKDLASLVGPEIADIIMADPDHLFKLDKKYIFSGFDETRSIFTSRWTATRNDIISSTGHNHKKVVVDYQFLTKYMDDIGEYTTAPLPVRIDITIYKDSDVTQIQERQTLNLLHLQTSFETYELNPFDIRDCFDMPYQRNWYKIIFDGGWNKGASQNQDQFKRDILIKISEESKTSFIRIPTVELDHDELFVYAHVLVLEPANYLLQFEAPVAAKPWTYDTQIKYSIKDDLLCSAFCLTHREVGFECRSFFECDGQSQNCYISNSKDAKTPSVDVPDCRHYVLSAPNPDYQAPNFAVLWYLKNRTLEHQFNFMYMYKDVLGIEVEGTFKGIGVEDEIFPGDPVFVDFIKDEFHIVRKHEMLAESHTKLQISDGSYSDCLLACDMASGFDCETFSYCYNDQTCYLSDFAVFYDIDPKDIVLQSDCVIMSRRYTADYTVIRGAFYQSDPKQVIHDVSYDGKCAFLCDNATDFTCRSFDVCYNTRKCYLYVERSIDIPDTKINHSIPLCDHFERNALVDFQKHPGQVLDGSRDRYIDGVSVKDCADTCEQEPDYGCLGFDFCGGDPNTCFLTSDHYGDDGVVVHNKPECDHYSREYYDGKSRDEFSHTKKSKYKYAPGDMAGLGVSMLVISIALTFGGVYIYNKRS